MLSGKSNVFNARSHILTTASLKVFVTSIAAFRDPFAIISWFSFIFWPVFHDYCSSALRFNLRWTLYSWA